MSYSEFVGRLAETRDGFNMMFQSRDYNAANFTGLKVPASWESISGMHIVTLSLHDIVRNGAVVNECSICISTMCIGNRVARLPCSHMFCVDCITSWLRISCDCPVCKYELPTSNVVFEIGRKMRMSERKLKVTTDDLRNMRISSLKFLMRVIDLSADNCIEKDDLIRTIESSDRVVKEEMEIVNIEFLEKLPFPEILCLSRSCKVNTEKLESQSLELENERHATIAKIISSCFKSLNFEEVHKGSEDDDTWFRRTIRKILSYLKISELIEILQSFGYYAAYKVGEHVDKDVLIESILGVCSLTLLPQILRKYIGASNVFPNLLLTALLAVINNYRSKNKQKKPKEPEEPTN